MSKKNKNIEINQQNQETVSLNFSNNLTIDEASDIKEALSEIINKGENILIKGKGISNIDLTFVQLLKSFERTCIKEGKNISIDLEIPEEVQALLANSGIQLIKTKN